MATARADVEALIAAVPDEQRRADAVTLVGSMEAITGEPPALWPGNIIGFGTYHYRYASGREGDAPLTGFSPRKQHLVIYLLSGIHERDADDLARLGSHRTGKSCLYIRRLADVDLDVLRGIIYRSVREVRGWTTG